jgi:hypothetical protein
MRGWFGPARPAEGGDDSSSSSSSSSEASSTTEDTASESGASDITIDMDDEDEDPWKGDPEDVYSTLAPHERRNLQAVTVRQRPQRLTAAKHATVMAALAERLDHSKALATWRNWGSVANNFREFDNLNRRTFADYDEMSLDVRMAYWVELKIQDGDLHRGTPVRYVKRLEQLYRKRFGKGSQVTADYRHALQRDGFNVGKGAIPATYEEVLLAMRHARRRGERMQLLAMWLLTGRCEDARRLKQEDFELGDEAQGAPLLVKVKWSEGAPKKPGEARVDVMVVPPEFTREMRAHIEKYSPERHPFTLSSDRISTLLRAANPELTSHSIKKGALRYLVLNGHKAEEVMHKARHSTLKQTRSYIGEELYGFLYNVRDVSLTLARALLPPGGQ